MAEPAGRASLGARARMHKRLANALKLWRDGRVGAPYRAPFEVVMRDATVALRRYGGVPEPSAGGAPRAVLLVPPLMVTSQIYDISPELSATATLVRHGVPTFVADFGAPEAQAGGLDRTLDDHVLAVSRCIDHLNALTGADVHLVGYSQGGMFCYQTAAYRKSAGVASIVTFGAPVDIRRNVPFTLNDKLAEKLIGGVRRLIDGPLEGLRALPGTLSSRAFKLLAPLQEVRHLVQLVGVLHDEEALARLEPKRRFLGGEGFTAWPGPALRTFIDDFVVGNRMKQGGFVIAGRTVALADITAPICYFVGEDDDLALPEAVRAISAAASRAQSYPVHVRAGHFGLVVGRAAQAVCWPTVIAWMAWQDGRGLRPAILDSAAQASPAPESGRVREAIADAADLLWERLGGFGVTLGRASDAVRWQLPRVLRRRLLALIGEAGGEAHVSLARSLRERAAELPDAVWFLYAGRAYTFLEAQQRVEAIALALLAIGVTAGQRVAVLVQTQPDALTAVSALNRIGASTLLIDERALHAPAIADRVPADMLCIVPQHDVAVARARLAGPIARLGRERSSPDAALADVFDLEAPVGADRVFAAALDRARLRDVALALHDRREGPARTVSNGQWISAGLDFAIDARLSSADTIYCPPTLELTGLLVAAAGALVGSARLQLGIPLDRTRIWDELMNTGATIVLADDALARELADAPLPDRHPVRLVMGQGLASEIASTLVDRLGVRTRYRPLAGLGR